MVDNVGVSFHAILVTIQVAGKGIAVVGTIAVDGLGNVMEVIT